MSNNVIGTQVIKTSGCKASVSQELNGSSKYDLKINGNVLGPIDGFTAFWEKDGLRWTQSGKNVAFSRRRTTTTLKPSSAPTTSKPTPSPTMPCAKVNGDFEIFDMSNKLIGSQTIKTTGCIASVTQELNGASKYELKINGNVLTVDGYTAFWEKDELRWTLNNANVGFSRRKVVQSLEFELRGKSGQENVRITVSGITKDLTLGKNWQKFTFAMPQDGKFSIQFSNDKSGRDVFYRSSLVSSVWTTRFNGWKCGQKSENNRCRKVRDGSYHWNGVYTHTIQKEECRGQFAHAKCANFVKPFILVKDEYAWVPDTAKDNNNNGAGKASFTFTCTENTVVQFSADVIAPNGKDDSFYITVDSQKRRTWHVKKGSDWHWAFHGTKFSVGKGMHTLHLLQREDGTKFKRIRIDTGATGCSFTENPGRRLLNGL